MSKKEYIKSVLDFYKSILITLLVGLFGLVSYAFTNSENLSLIKLSMIVFAIVFIFISLYYLYKAIAYKLNELKKED